MLGGAPPGPLPLSSGIGVFSLLRDAKCRNPTEHSTLSSRRRAVVRSGSFSCHLKPMEN